MAGLVFIGSFGTAVWGKNDLKTLPILSTSTFVTGDLLQWVVASGYMSLAAASGNAIGASLLLAGIAMEPALDPVTGVVKSSVEIVVAREGQRWIVPLYSATVASTNPVSTTLSASYNFWNNGSGAWAADYDDTTHKYCNVTDFVTEDYPGWPGVTAAASPAVAYPWVEVEFRGATCAFSGVR